MCACVRVYVCVCTGKQQELNWLALTNMHVKYLLQPSEINLCLAGGYELIHNISGMVCGIWV